jgi:hypothetical protein
LLRSCPTHSPAERAGIENPIRFSQMVWLARRGRRDFQLGGYFVVDQTAIFEVREPVGAGPGVRCTPAGYESRHVLGLDEKPNRPIVDTYAVVDATRGDT